ncbi:hypothetical protein FRC11_005744 [Ceratobasidium sp. 423]|nr:hypothetical protein FRC11_005744 [Ceratobasidium sp. 423]
MLAQSTRSHGHYENSDMDHGYGRRNTFQSEASSHYLVHNHHDPRCYNGQPPYDPYASRRDTDTEPELEHPYPAQPYKSSNYSLPNQQRPAPSEVSSPTFNGSVPGVPREPCPAWGADRREALLNRNPKYRLGAHRDAEELKEHPLFKSIDWVALAQRQVPPPFKPSVESDGSTACFDPEFISADLKETGVDVLLDDDDPLDQEIEDIFLDLTQKFGSQSDSMRD